MSTRTDVNVTKEEAGRLSEIIYEKDLKFLLEPFHHKRIVVIHIPSRDYFVGDSLLEVSDRLRQKHSTAGRGEVYAGGVGERIVIRARTPHVRPTPISLK